MQSTARIWVLDSELSLQGSYRQALSRALEVKYFPSFSRLQTALETCHRPHLILVDPATVPGQWCDFLKLCDSRGSDFAPIGFFILSHYNDIEFMKFATLTGASFYIVKPFEPAVLSSQIDTVLERLARTPTFSISNCRESISIRNLSLFEHRLLTLLLAEADRTMTYQRIQDELGALLLHSLDISIFNLRRKLRYQGYDLLHENRAVTLTKTSRPNLSLTEKNER
jgi:DNA-binding response OmpR family regulator